MEASERDDSSSPRRHTVTRLKKKRRRLVFPSHGHDLVGRGRPRRAMPAAAPRASGRPCLCLRAHARHTLHHAAKTCRLLYCTVYATGRRRLFYRGPFSMRFRFLIFSDF